MKARELAVSGLLIVSAPLLHANGGGYFRGGVEHAGDVAGFAPKATENIRILDEKLTINLGPKEADVEVRYLMRNETAKKVKVRFGFPVEESFDRDLMEAVGEEKKLPDGKKPAYCRNYQIAAAGKTIKATWQGEVRNTTSPQFRGVAGWLISEITFAANEEIPVMIRFQSAYPVEAWSVNDNGSRSAAVFRYRLSSAACWAGTIGSGKILIKPNGIAPSWLKALKPVNRFRKEGANLVWNFENLEPTLADDLEIEARPAERSYPARQESGSEYIERNGGWTMAHSNYQVKASSTLPPEGEFKYDAENVRIPWGRSMWADGAKGPGIGEWLELESVAPKPLTAISIFPGCGKSDALFEANARPKKVLVELNGDHRFTVEVPNSKEEFEFPVSNYTKPVRKLRLTFQEVWPGKRFEDLCISGVRLHVRLDKKPKIQQAR